MTAAFKFDSVVGVLQILLWAFWLLCTLAATVTAVDAPVPDVFKAAVRLAAARGKTWDSKPAALGWLKDASVPHVWFWHFYLIGVLANMAVLGLLLATHLAEAGQGSATADASVNISAAVVVTVVLLTHLVRRLVETVFVMRYPPGARMHVLAYVYGLAYYAVLSLSFLPPQLLRAALTLVLPCGSPPATASPGDSAMHAAAASQEESTAAATAGCSSGDRAVESMGLVMAGMARGAAAALAEDRLLLAGCTIIMLGQLLQSHSHFILASLSATKRQPTHASHASDRTSPPAPSAAPDLRRRNTPQATSLQAQALDDRAGHADGSPAWRLSILWWELQSHSAGTAARSPPTQRSVRRSCRSSGDAPLVTLLW
eukprot:jgi/Ulvmu1/10626/UM066_0005.1